MLKRAEVKYHTGDQIKPANLSRQEVEQYADKVAEVCKFKPGDSVAELIKELDGRVHVVDFDDLLDGRTGAVVVHGKFDFDVQIPEHTSPRRDRFTMAHELGHYFIHSKQGEQPLIAFRRGSGRVEWEANWFAAALLMPAKEFRRVAKDVKEDVILLASHFKVSQDAAEIRLKTLSI